MPSAVVLVATVRALKMHGGGPAVIAGRPLDHAYTSENLDLVRAGCVNLEKHVENARKYGVNVVVALNRFASDTDAELATVREAAITAGAFDAVVCSHHAEGGAGAVELGKRVADACAAGRRNDFKFLYPLESTLKEKIDAIAFEMYGAAGVEYMEQAETQIV